MTARGRVFDQTDVDIQSLRSRLSGQGTGTKLEVGCRTTGLEEGEVVEPKRRLSVQSQVIQLALFLEKFQGDGSFQGNDRDRASGVVGVRREACLTDSGAGAATVRWPGADDRSPPRPFTLNVAFIGRPSHARGPKTRQR